MLIFSKRIPHPWHRFYGSMRSNQELYYTITANINTENRNYFRAGDLISWDPNKMMGVPVKMGVEGPIIGIVSNTATVDNSITVTMRVMENLSLSDL